MKNRSTRQGMHSGALSAIKSGAWITRRRLVGYSSILIGVYGIAIGWTLITADGLVDAAGRPIGTDFSNVWSAGQLLLRGSPELAYEPARHHAEQQRIFDDTEIPFYGWHYPPIFLVVAGALALLPYLPALFLWQAATASLYLLAVRRIAPQRIALALAVAFPPFLINLTHGHNGFLTASLLGGGLIALRSRPILSGVLFGLLAYKPHFGALIPFALAAGGHWRAFASAAATVIALIAGTILLFGAEIWVAFFESTAFTTTVVLEAGGTSWYKQQSAFALARSLGGRVELAYAIQFVTALACIVAVIRLWRSSADFALQAAGLVAGTLLATPYVYDYDLMALAPAIAFVGVYGSKSGFIGYEKSILGFAWIAPFFSRALGAVVPLSLGLWAMVLLMAVILAHAARTAGLSASRTNADGRETSVD